MKQKKNLWVNLLFAAVVLVIAGVLFYLRSAGQSGSTLGAELIYGDANTSRSRTARHGSLIPPALTTSAKALAGSRRRIRRPPACRHGPF